MSFQRKQLTEDEIEEYVQRSQHGPCFVCQIVRGEAAYQHHMIYEDEQAIVFLNMVQPLYGHTLVAPRQHREHAVADFTTEEYLSLQRLVVRNVCNDWLIGTGAFPAMPGFWRQPLGSPAFHPSFQGCWSTSPLRRTGGSASRSDRAPVRPEPGESASQPARALACRSAASGRPVQPTADGGAEPEERRSGHV